MNMHTFQKLIYSVNNKTYFLAESCSFHFFFLTTKPNQQQTKTAATTENMLLLILFFGVKISHRKQKPFQQTAVKQPRQIIVSQIISFIMNRIPLNCALVFLCIDNVPYLKII